MNWRTLPTQLELADVLWQPDENGFTARGGAAQVRVARGRRGAVAVEVMLNRDAPFEWIGPRGAKHGGGEVASGDAQFDAEVRVEAKAWNRDATQRWVASPSVRPALRAFVALGGAASSNRLTVTLKEPDLNALKRALQTALGLASACALVSHERRPPPPAGRPTGSRPAAVQIEEDSETTVDQWAPKRFRIHNPWLQPGTFALDLTAGTLQVASAAPIPLGSFGSLVVVAGVEPMPSSLQRQTDAGATFPVCSGRRRSLESLMRALELLGVLEAQRNP